MADGTGARINAMRGLLVEQGYAIPVGARTVLRRVTGIIEAHDAAVPEVVGGGLRLAAIGAGVGVAGSLVLLRSLRTLLFGVTPNDFTTYVAVVVHLCGVAALASYVPARWAARVEPLTALRQD